MPVDGVMVREKYGVKLAPEERERLEGLVRSGKSPARVMARARILLKTGKGWKAPKVAEALDVSEGTVFRIKRRFAEEGLEGVLRDRPQPSRPRKLDERREAHLIALACSLPQRDMTTGPCACWLARWWNWGWPRRCPIRESASGSKKRSQAVAEDGVAHPEGERGFRGQRGQHGGRAGPVRGTP